ncbi:MAG: hypothetical protein K9N47_06325 [Prosthecobacter sp.]|nr:hypothetical protein [Prosthecobacter sp.]
MLEPPHFLHFQACELPFILHRCDGDACIVNVNARVAVPPVADDATGHPVAIHDKACALGIGLHLVHRGGEFGNGDTGSFAAIECERLDGFEIQFTQQLTIDAAGQHVIHV